MISDTLQPLPFSFAFDCSVGPFPSVDFIYAPWERDCAYNFTCTGMQSDREQPSDLAHVPIVVEQSDDTPRENLAAVTVLGDVAVDLPPSVTDPSQIAEGSSLRVAAQDFHSQSGPAQQSRQFESRTDESAATAAMPIPSGHLPGTPFDAAAYHQQALDPQVAASLPGQGMYFVSILRISFLCRTSLILSRLLFSAGYYVQTGPSARGTGSAATVGTQATTALFAPGQPPQAQNPGRAHRFCHACHHVSSSILTSGNGMS